MIYDKLENMVDYPILTQVKKFLDAHNGEILENGRYEIDGKCYLTVLEYETFEGKDFEAHREYVDVQMLIRGQEYIYVQDIQKGKLITEYNQEKDISFYKTDDSTAYLLDNTNFLVLDVNDLHKPCVSVDKAEIVKKYVFKIKKGV